LSEEELHAALRLLAISVIILPVLPDEPFGPYDALNLRNIWLMVVFISGLSFLGYWLIRFMGEGKGILLTGLAGGLASSTATTLSLSRMAKDGAEGRAAAAGGPKGERAGGGGGGGLHEPFLLLPPDAETASAASLSVTLGSRPSVWPFWSRTTSATTRPPLQFG